MFDYDDQDERIIEALEEVMEDGGFVHSFPTRRSSDHRKSVV